MHRELSQNIRRLQFNTEFVGEEGGRCGPTFLRIDQSSSESLVERHSGNVEGRGESDIN